MSNVHESRPEVTRDVYAELLAAGVPLDHHASDLYAKATPEAWRIIRDCGFRGAVTFTSRVDNPAGELWIDLPFAYTPFWTDETIRRETREYIASCRDTRWARKVQA